MNQYGCAFIVLMGVDCGASSTCKWAFHMQNVTQSSAPLLNHSMNKAVAYIFSLINTGMTVTLPIKMCSPSSVNHLMAIWVDIEKVVKMLFLRINVIRHTDRFDYPNLSVFQHCIHGHNALFQISGQIFHQVSWQVQTILSTIQMTCTVSATSRHNLMLTLCSEFWTLRWKGDRIACMIICR